MVGHRDRTRSSSPRGGAPTTSHLARPSFGRTNTLIRPPSYPTPHVEPRTRTSSWSPPSCRHFFQFWRNNPIIKLALLSTLALFDILGDVIFLSGIRYYPLVAPVGYYFNTPSIPQVKVIEMGTRNNYVQKYLYDKPDRVLTCVETARTRIARFQPGACDTFFQYTEPAKNTSALSITSSPERTDGIYLTIPRYKQLLTCEEEFYDLDYHAYLYNTKATEFSKTYTNCFDLMRHETMACLMELKLPSTRTVDLTFSLDGMGFGGLLGQHLWQWDHIDLGSFKLPSTIITTLAYALLDILLLKEAIKALGVVSYFFHPYFHNPKNFVFISTSPLAFLPLFFSPSFSEAAINTVTNNEDTTWPIFWDLFLQDLPQLFLPIFLMSITRSKSTIAILSLTGSIIMVIVGIIRTLPTASQQEHSRFITPTNSPVPTETEMVNTIMNPLTLSPPPALVVVPESEGFDERMVVVEGGLQRMDYSLQMILNRLEQLERQLPRPVVVEEPRTIVAGVVEGGNSHNRQKDVHEES